MQSFQPLHRLFVFRCTFLFLPIAICGGERRQADWNVLAGTRPHPLHALASLEESSLPGLHHSGILPPAVRLQVHFTLQNQDVLIKSWSLVGFSAGLPDRSQASRKTWIFACNVAEVLCDRQILSSYYIQRLENFCSTSTRAKKAAETRKTTLRACGALRVAIGRARATCILAAHVVWRKGWQADWHILSRPGEDPLHTETFRQENA
mmetsp:Transcript_5183/g.12870  ORF Transcript_5183/g.12870 Transcript_5183/m.12870 type:complete len:207 (-) Transcript_5183:314-934(-)